MRSYTNFDLTEYNSYRVKATCSRALFPESEEDIIGLYKDNKPFILLGSGHNIILSKEVYNDTFVIFNGNFESVHVHKDEQIIEAESGITMLELSEIALENDLSGIEIFFDIPSSLGGAVVMNAGASGEEIKDVLIKVRYLDLSDMVVKEKAKEEIDFEYRNSFFQKNQDKIVLRSWLKLQKKEPAEIKLKMELIKEQRWAKQPKEYPNAGSVFKRPPGYYVGALIDELELKGLTAGGAQISKKHGGFIVNTGGATGQDILKIIAEVKKRVKELHGVELEVEQRVI